MVILYIYNILNMNVLYINLLLKINENKWVKNNEDKYDLNLMRVNMSIWLFRINFKSILPNNLNT